MVTGRIEVLQAYFCSIELCLRSSTVQLPAVANGDIISSVPYHSSAKKRTCTFFTAAQQDKRPRTPKHGTECMNA